MNCILKVDYKNRATTVHFQTALDRLKRKNIGEKIIQIISKIYIHKKVKVGM